MPCPGKNVTFGGFSSGSGLAVPRYPLAQSLEASLTPVSSSPVQWQWLSDLGEAAVFPFVSVPALGRRLPIAVGTLRSGLVYRVAAQACDVLTSCCWKGSIFLSLVPVDPKAVIDGPASRTVSGRDTIVIDGTASHGDTQADPSAGYRLLFQWSCSADGGSACKPAILGAIGDSNSANRPVLTVSAMGADAGVYSFKIVLIVNWTNGVQFLASAPASVVISVAPGVVPALVMEGPSAVADSWPFSLRVKSQPVVVGAQLAWTVSVRRNNEDVPLGATGSNSGVLSVRAGTYTPGEYTFTATQAGNNEFSFSLVSHVVTVVGAPTGGSITVSPPTGTCGNTTFSVAAPGWTSPIGALSYVFYVSGASDQEQIALGGGVSSSNVLETTLMSPTPAQRAVVKVGVLVRNEYGASAGSLTSVTLDAMFSSKVEAARATLGAVRDMSSINGTDKIDRLAEVGALLGASNDMVHESPGDVSEDVRQSLASAREAVTEQVLEIASRAVETSDLPPFSVVGRALAAAVGDVSAQTEQMRTSSVAAVGLLLNAMDDANVEVSQSDITFAASTIDLAAQGWMQSSDANIVERLDTAVTALVHCAVRDPTLGDSPVTISGSSVAVAALKVGYGLAGSDVPIVFSPPLTSIFNPPQVSLSPSMLEVGQTVRIVGVTADTHPRAQQRPQGHSLIIVLGANGEELHRTVLSEPPDLFIPYTRTASVPSGMQAGCAYWDSSSSSWSTAGMRTVGGTRSGYIQCQSTHLSEFNVVLVPNDSSQPAGPGADSSSSSTMMIVVGAGVAVAVVLLAVLARKIVRKGKNGRVSPRLAGPSSMAAAPSALFQPSSSGLSVVSHVTIEMVQPA